MLFYYLTHYSNITEDALIRMTVSPTHNYTDSRFLPL